MKRASGYLQAYVNQLAYRRSPADKAMIAAVTRIARAVLSGAQVRWAGSVYKGTAIEGSDLDMCLETSQPVTESDRRSLRTALASGLKRDAVVRSHVVRLPSTRLARKVDVSFANAAFGSRPLPDPSDFRDRPARQTAARAVKIWARSGGLPTLPGWVVEAIVVHLDVNQTADDPLTLLRRVLDWLADRAKPADLESILRPAAHPMWRAEWSRQVPGRLEAVANGARSLRRRADFESWRGADDVARWLGR